MGSSGRRDCVAAGCCRTARASEQDASSQIQADNNGTDYTQPQSSFDLRANYRDSSGTSSRTKRDGLLLRLTRKINLDAGFKFAVFAQLPVEAKATTTSDFPVTDHESGIGNALFQAAALTHAINKRWAFGFGARLVAPIPPYQ